MVSGNLEKFSKAIKNNDPDRASELIEEILKDKKKSIESKKVEELLGVEHDKAAELEKAGYNSIKDIVKAGAEELSEISKIGRKSAEKIEKSAINEIEKEFLDLPGVGPDKAENIRKNGFYSIKDLAKASINEIAEVSKIGEKGAEKIINSAKEKLDEEKKIEGYRRALEGILTTLDSDRVLTLSQKISKGKYSEEKLETIEKEMENRASHEFRPAKERGFNEAWRDVMEVLS